MKQPVLTIFYQFNPWQSTVGGIQTVVINFIKYAPKEFQIRLVGTATSSQHKIGKWAEVELADRNFLFLPLFKLEDDNIRNVIPTTLKYTLALVGHNFTSDFMHFHRLEPMLSAWHWPGEKYLFVHNDIQQQMVSSINQNAILWRRFPSFYFALERLLIGQFSQIYSCNSNSLKFYQQCYLRLAKRFQFIKNTVDTEIFYPLTVDDCANRRCALAKRLDVSEDTHFLLFAGRLHPQKDPSLLLQALTSLNDLKVHLLMAGEGELAAELKEEIVQRQLSQQVTMLGALSQLELADLYRVSSVFVLTSWYEGLPMTVLESLACGTPVVTTRCGETPNILSQATGIVCEERTPSAIAEALRSVLMQPEDYPTSACTQAARPYWAKTVVTDIYREMWQQWLQKQDALIQPIAS